MPTAVNANEESSRDGRRGADVMGGRDGIDPVGQLGPLELLLQGRGRHFCDVVGQDRPLAQKLADAASALIVGM